MTTTNRTADVSRLVAALRAKFSSRSKLCEALGIDEALLEQSSRQLGKGPRLGLDAKGNRLPIARDQEQLGPNGSAPTENAAQQLRLAIEEVLRDCEGGAGAGDVKRIIALLEKHAPLNNGDEEPDEELRKREQMPPALDVEAFSKVLRGKGVDEETIKSAVDMLPKSALELGPGGRFAMKRAGAMDERLDRKFGLGRIEAWGGADQAVDRRPVLSRTGMDKLAKKFPGVENVIV